ncbi:predicted protein [Sclerotinia sclerotiorum 1980 UF-70]|uniref:Uncharacterized protein n=1 Tax=Sclerotinia sclerotiorum (strain ATCC 18683 / 1980 / Ss-1) TaxID=665079 RepID=A7EHI6_SCLS1|nr:predicted protein [Sclerotinia sclerotiorum 1980 UF-70]EDO02302.1 predicted protein [Sclerotinia sclerotiorum 1980 UF-70]
MSNGPASHLVATPNPYSVVYSNSGIDCPRKFLPCLFAGTLAWVLMKDGDGRFIFGARMR